jgi:hypothetical protein
METCRAACSRCWGCWKAMMEVFASEGGLLGLEVI